MKRKNQYLLGGAATILCLSGLAFATPTVGLLLGTILTLGTDNNPIDAYVHVALPTPAGTTSEDGDENEWNASVHSNGPSNIIVQDVVYAPGGHTGWHSHPGILLSSVIEGSIEWYDSKCTRHVYNAGDAFTETSQLHYVRNVGTSNAHFMVTYMIAKGQPRRIDQPAPACAVAAGIT